MSKYYSYSRQAPPKPRPWKIHPIWRGIGCIMFLLIPILSYAGAILLVEANTKQRWVPATTRIMRSVTVPGLGAVEHLYANLMVTLVLMLVGFAGVVALYTLVFSIFGPSSLGPLDAPPERRSTRRVR
ncbi:MAG: hypothetical protein PHS96_07550 [Anaerolineales bacterium]|nr:hypothetical protein [Anaerolineales bacterium]